MIASNIKNIIFDLGGLFLAIDYNKTASSFKKLNLQNFDEIYSKMQQSNLFDDFETGTIQENEFVCALKKHLPSSVTSTQIIDAWNAMLLYPIKENIQLLNDLKKKYRLFLFSNTNAIHLKAFSAILKKEFGKDNLSNYFEKSYYSHLFGMRKPDEDAFRKLLENHQLIARETLFLDDSIQHVEGAKNAGINSIHVNTNGLLKPFLLE